MKIYFMKQKALDSLQAEVADNLNKYQSSSFWMDEHFINQNMPKYYFDTGIEVADYQLISGGPETDFQNAKIVFEAFKNKLNPVQASDLRLWAYLAHVQHWEYMSHRWKIDIPDEEDDEGSEERKKSPREKMIDRVKTRYFFGDSRGKAFVRQGIARLYWSAYLTYDDTNDNPYEYTEFFLSKCNLFVCFFIHRLKCNLKSQFLIKSNCFFNIICRNPDMLNPCCICFQIHLNVPSFLQPVQVPALQGSRLSSLHKGLPPRCQTVHTLSVHPW